MDEENGEDCDDGNVRDGDGCNIQCKKEDVYHCKGEVKPFENFSVWLKYALLPYGQLGEFKADFIARDDDELYYSLNVL